MSQELSSVNHYGNIWVRELVFIKKGDYKNGHKHSFDHVHFVAAGSVRIDTKDDTEATISSKEYIAPAWIKVPKEVYHSVTALEDMTLGYCIEAIRDENGLVIETDTECDTCTDNVPKGLRDE